MKHQKSLKIYFIYKKVRNYPWNNIQKINDIFRFNGRFV